MSNYLYPPMAPPTNICLCVLAVILGKTVAMGRRRVNLYWLQPVKTAPLVYTVGWLARVARASQRCVLGSSPRATTEYAVTKRCVQEPIKPN